MPPVYATVDELARTPCLHGGRIVRCQVRDFGKKSGIGEGFGRVWLSYRVGDAEKRRKALIRETPMRVAYLTTDEVNEELARQMAQECGLTLCPLAPKDDPPDGAYDAVLYDWDSWPAEGRREALAAMLAGPLPHAVALHGYHLEDD